MNPTLLDLGFLQIRWYSVLVLSAFVIGYVLVLHMSKKKGLSQTNISDLCFYLVISCILGARIYYCLFYKNDIGINPYFENPIDILKIWEGGLAIHGGIIAGFICILIYSKIKQLKLLELLDIFAPALVIGQSIGRWGNFFNSEAFGRVVSLETLNKLHIPNFIIKGMFIDGDYHHPTFLYESIGCLIIFLLLIIIKNIKNIKNGQVVSVYFMLYGLLRFFIESLRTDSLMLFNFKAAQIVSIIMFLIGVFLFIRPYFRRNHD